MVKKPKNKYSEISVGYTHYLRSGAGPHKDQKKEINKKKCRRRLKTDEE